VFVYADENVQKDEHAEMFRGYVVTRLATKEDGSILMAAPTYGFTAYSQIYADLIAQINAHYRMSRRTGQTVEDIVVDKDLRELALRMILLMNGITRIKIDQSQIDERIAILIRGVWDVYDGLESAKEIDELMEEFLTQAAAMHLWSLPYVKAIEWQTIKDRLEAEARMLQSV